MKKLTYYLLSIPLILSLTACSNSSSGTEKKGSSSTVKNDIDEGNSSDDIIITMATNGIDFYDINGENMIDKFNKLNNGYKIKTKSYAIEDINDDNTLCLDIMKGEVVDIVCDCFYDPGKFHTLAEKGAFCDLNTFLENDPQVNRNTLNEHILELCEINNELPYLPYGYVINTLVGFSKYVGEKENWSFDDMIDLWKKMPSNSLIGGVGNLNTKDYVYLNILSMNMSSFIDFDNCKAYYNSKEFLDILNFCNSFDYGEGFYKGGEKTDAPLFLWGLHISGYDDFHANLLSYKEPITFVGYPSNNGNGTQIELTGSIMAISAMSSQEKQKGAWEFLKMFAEEEYQKNMAIPQNEDTDNGMSDNQFCFPINNKVFEELGKERYDKENESNIVSINGEETDIGYISKNEYDRLVNIINNTKRVNIHMENDIIDIINDEIWAMFADEKSPEEVAKNIQERVETMISERR